MPAPPSGAAPARPVRVAASPPPPSRTPRAPPPPSPPRACSRPLAPSSASLHRSMRDLVRGTVRRRTLCKAAHGGLLCGELALHLVLLLLLASDTVTSAIDRPWHDANAACRTSSGPPPASSSYLLRTYASPPAACRRSGTPDRGFSKRSAAWGLSIGAADARTLLGSSLTGSCGKFLPFALAALASVLDQKRSPRLDIAEHQTWRRYA